MEEIVLVGVRRTSLSDFWTRAGVCTETGSSERTEPGSLKIALEAIGAVTIVLQRVQVFVS